MKDDYVMALMAKQLSAIAGQSIFDTCQKNYGDLTEEETAAVVFLAAAMTYASISNFLNRDLHTATGLLMEIYKDINAKKASDEAH